MPDQTTNPLPVHRPIPARAGAGLMATFDSLPESLQDIAKAMSDAAREAMRDAEVKPLNDDRAAVFDEACAVYLAETLNATR